MNSRLTAAVAPEGVLHAGPAGLPDLADLLGASVASIGAWMSEYGPFLPHPSMDVSIDDLLVATEDLHDRLRDNSCPSPAPRCTAPSRARPTSSSGPSRRRASSFLPTCTSKPRRT